MRNHTTNHGFTLIELLVVVAIIITLLAILMPSMNRAIEAAHRTVCVSNQHQIAFGSLGYAMDNLGAMPVIRGWAPHAVYTNINGTLADARPTLSALVGDQPEVFYCPSQLRVSYDDPDVGWNGSNASLRFSSYSLIGLFEQSITPGASAGSHRYMNMPAKHPSNRPERISQAISPASMAISTDSQNTYTNDGSSYIPFSYPGYESVPWPESNYWAAYTYPHREGANRWAGSAAAMYDGSGGWGDFDEIFDADAPYPFGAKWKLHDGWTPGGTGIFGLEGCIYW